MVFTFNATRNARIVAEFESLTKRFPSGFVTVEPVDGGTRSEVPTQQAAEMIERGQFRAVEPEATEAR